MQLKTFYITLSDITLLNILMLNINFYKSMVRLYFFFLILSIFEKIQGNQEVISNNGADMRYKLPIIHMYRRKSKKKTA